MGMEAAFDWREREVSAAEAVSAVRPGDIVDPARFQRRALRSAVSLSVKTRYTMHSRIDG
jgi:hypothetical protein